MTLQSDMFINGAFAPALDHATDPVLAPATGEQYAEVARGSAADVDRAVESAHAAFPAWARTTPADRARALLKLADRGWKAACQADSALTKGLSKELAPFIAAAFFPTDNPTLSLLRPIPVTAWLPLSMIFFGLGPRSAVFLQAFSRIALISSSIACSGETPSDRTRSG